MTERPPRRIRVGRPVQRALDAPPGRCWRPAMAAIGRPRRGPVPLVAAVLLLSACSSPPTPAPRPTPSGPGFSWPALPGRVLMTADRFGERFARIRTPDPEAASAQARSLLVDGGYRLTKDRPGDGGGDGQACRASTGVCVNFTATDDPEFGPSLLYEAFDSTGTVPL